MRLALLLLMLGTGLPRTAPRPLTEVRATFSASTVPNAGACAGGVAGVGTLLPTDPKVTLGGSWATLGACTTGVYAQRVPGGVQPYVEFCVVGVAFMQWNFYHLGNGGAVGVTVDGVTVGTFGEEQSCLAPGCDGTATAPLPDSGAHTVRATLSDAPNVCFGIEPTYFTLTNVVLT